MSIEYPHVNVALDGRLYGAVSELAENHGVSMSMMMRELVREAMEIREDVALANIAEQREQTFAPTEALTHEEVWG